MAHELRGRGIRIKKKQFLIELYINYHVDTLLPSSTMCLALLFACACACACFTPVNQDVMRRRRRIVMAEKRSSVGGEKGGVRRATGCPVKQSCVSFPGYTEWWCIPFRSFLSSWEGCIYTKIFSSQWCMIDELRHPLV